MNKLEIDGIEYINLLSHSIKIMSNKTLYEIDGCKGEIPRLQTVSSKVEGEPLETFTQKVIGITNLPKMKENTILIVSLFILNGYQELNGFVRQDLRSPGKKIYGDGGKTSFAVGLKKIK